MPLPIRCWTCGKVLRNYKRFEKLIRKYKKENSPQDMALDDLKMKRYCCRRMYLSHDPKLDEMLEMYGQKSIYTEEKDGKEIIEKLENIAH